MATQEVRQLGPFSTTKFRPRKIGPFSRQHSRLMYMYNVYSMYIYIYNYICVYIQVYDLYIYMYLFACMYSMILFPFIHIHVYMYIYTYFMYTTLEYIRLGLQDRSGIEYTLLCDFVMQALGHQRSMWRRRWRRRQRHVASRTAVTAWAMAGPSYHGEMYIV